MIRSYGLKSIVCLGLAVWVIELGETPMAQEMDDIVAKTAEVMRGAGVAYGNRQIRHLAPGHCGHPARRTRTCTMGWRHDLVDMATVGLPLECLIHSLMTVDATFWSFLDLQCAADCSRAGEFATTPVEVAATSLS